MTIKKPRPRGRPPGIKACPEFDAPTRWTEGLISRIGEIASPKQINAAKNYARAGRVIELNVSPGLIEAKVQGRRRAPYAVRLCACRPDARDLENVLRRICEKAIYKTTLLYGDIPPDLEDIFKSSGVTLSLGAFNKSRRLCGCSEPETVCKHIIAVLYVVSVAFDRDPFMLLKFRGLDKKELMELLCAPVGADLSLASTPLGDRQELCRDEGALRPETIPASVGREFFAPWDLCGVLETHAVPSPESGHPMPILDFPLWRGETSFADSIAPYYKTVKKFLKGIAD
jgi:uncharacterized Zn finger protein